MAGGRGGEHLGHDPHRTHLADDLTDAYRALTRRPRAHPRRVDPALMTTALTDELSRTTPTKACCRRAETITLGQMMDPPMTKDAVAGGSGDSSPSPTTQRGGPGYPTTTER